MEQPRPSQRVPVRDLVAYFLYLGSLGFGGPVALVGYMQRDLVERRGWFTRDEYLKSLALSQLAPGPLAAQLAICLGYVHSRVRGATPSPDADLSRQREVVEAFLAASRAGDFEGLLRVLDPDVVFRVDVGGAGPFAREPITGAGYQPLVRGMNRTLARLAQEIAREIQSRADTRAAGS